ncbi:TonB-dependent receptor [Emcibacter sp.]|uniref:TonB-dependent receptor n=1 Tax=Emcibacter sp. TaxID=1979954 RepID=UPI002AA836A2|nr:TonB-dependent receptor [Emcibacter sp.]
MRRTPTAILLLSTASTLAFSAQPSFSQEEEIFVIEEVIVTARRRAESLTDVPGTVTALTQTALESAGVQRADDFIALTPGVTMVDAAEVGDTQVNIRGINGARDAENSFAFILDGILYTNPAAFNREYTDLAQIEIFKGPQGAIYGRNAAAGAIIVKTTKPDNETITKITGGIAEDNTYLIKGSTSGAIVEDELFYRLSGDWRKSDGYYRNSFKDDAATIDAYEGYNVNARLVWEGLEDLSLDMRMRYGKVDASSLSFNSTFNLPVFAEATSTPAAYQDVNDFDFLYQANVDSDNDQESFEASTKFDYDLDGMVLSGWVLYSNIKNNLIADGTAAAFGFFNGDAACQQSVADLNAAGVALLAPQFIGLTPTGVIFDPNGSFLGAYTPTTCDGLQEQKRNQKDLSAELRLSSDGDGPLSWMVGAYFLDIDREVGVSLNRDSGDAPIRGLYQATGPNATVSLLHDQFDSRVLAVFGQLEYDISEDVELSLALRYDNEKRSVSSLVPTDATQSLIDLNFDGIFDDPLNPGLSSLINPTGTIPDKERTFSELEPKVSITWDASEDMTLYASWGVGFKAGGFNNSGSAATVNIFNNSFINGGIGINFADLLGADLPVVNDDYEKETSSAFEAGFKADLLDGRLQLTGSGYYTTVNDMQFFEFYVGSFGLLRVVSNMDKVELYGAEFGGTFHVNENVRLYGGVNFVESEIKENSSRPDTVGNKSPYTPDYTVNVGADVNYPINDDLEVFARADAQFIGPTWFHTVQEGQRPTIFQPLFELGFGAGAGALGIADYTASRRDAYYTVDLRLGVRGENWSLTGYVTNLTDEKYLEEVIPAPEFGGSFDHPGSERRFGAEVSFEF